MINSPAVSSKLRNMASPRQLPTLLLFLLISGYAIYFSGYTINRHNSLNSYAADLSLIDQPMWNTVRGPGSFMELTWGDRQQPRLAEHFEPILVPLAFLFFIWDDVRMLLIAQSLALALGALPVYWIARDQFAICNSQFAICNWAALAFAAAYLLYPHLQAANIADFHADPFVVTPLLLAVWYATRQRWRWMWLWAIIAMLTKENLPTLTAMLGLWLVFDGYRIKKSSSQPPIQNPKSKTSTEPSRRIQNGLALILTSTAWFLIATFLIVAPLAGQYFGSDGPIYLANRFSTELTPWLTMLQNPARWQYLLGLLAAVGFLPLLAPELLLLGLPVLVANLFSNFPGQYSGEQHYSAPLVAAFVLAAIFGTRRLLNNVSLREINGRSLKTSALIATCLWLLSWSLGYHTLHGWTPLSLRTEPYPLTPAARALPNLLAAIPPNAAVSASAGLHPHVAHRRVAYIFPTVQEADYLLVDVTDIPAVHPYDAHAKITEMLATRWTILETGPGLLLAQKSASSAPAQLPDTFFNFVRPTTHPQYPLSLNFGDDHLRLLGYDLHDDPDDGVTLRFYWQAAGPLPPDLKLWPLIYDDLGQLLLNPTQVPMITPVWYPPHRWEAAEIITTETLPQRLPDRFHLGLTTGLTAGSFGNIGKRLPVSGAGAGSRQQPGRWVQLASFARQGPFLIQHLPQPTFHTLTPVDAQFGDAIRLSGFWLDATRQRPGHSLPLLLQWRTRQPPPTDYTVFVHLLAPDGQLVSQSDAFPTWLTPQPTSQWPLDQPILDRHTLPLPAGLPSGTYSLHAGLYDAQTLQRLSLPDGSDSIQLSQIHIE